MQHSFASDGVHVRTPRHRSPSESVISTPEVRLINGDWGCLIDDVDRGRNLILDFMSSSYRDSSELSPRGERPQQLGVGAHREAVAINHA